MGSVDFLDLAGMRDGGAVWRVVGKEPERVLDGLSDLVKVLMDS